MKSAIRARSPDLGSLNAAFGVCNGSVEAMQDSGRCSGSALPPSSLRYGLTTIRLQTEGSTPFVQLCLREMSACVTQQKRLCGSGIQKDYYIFMTALVTLDGLQKRALGSATWIADFTSHAQAFGREPNALPQLRNCFKRREPIGALSLFFRYGENSGDSMHAEPHLCTSCHHQIFF